MTDTFARMRQLVGSTADWAANNIVIGDGEIAVERVSAIVTKMKVGNGTARYSDLPYAAGGDSTTISSSVQTALDGKLSLAGGTMTGLVVLSGDPTANLGATTKQYVDSAVAGVSTNIAGKVNKSGDTMTGFLILNADPTVPLGAATKQYVDGRVAKSGDTMTGALTLAADPVTNLEAATKRYVDAVPSHLGITTSAGTGSSGKLVVVGTNGKIDASFLPIGAQYKGSTDITQAYTAPTPPLNNGDYYTVAKDGTTSPTWRAVIDGNPHTLMAGQQLLWDGTWFHVSGGGAAIGDIDVGTF